MKKIFVLALMSVLMCAGFVACGGDDSKDPLGGEEDVKTPKPFGTDTGNQGHPHCGCRLQHELL